MHRHRNSELVHRSDAIGVTVGGKSHQGLARKHAEFQAAEITVDWFRIYSTKERVAIGAYSFNLKCRAAKEVLNRRSGFGRCTSAPGSFYLETVKGGWVVRGGDDNAARRLQLLHCPGNKGGGHRFAEK